MALAFAGEARPISDEDFERAARRLGCETAVICAVAQVESGGRSGFLGDGRPRILFESRWFHTLTNGRFDESHPALSTPKWVRNYAGGAAEYDRLEQAIGLDRNAALCSASWGMFQILGVNHEIVGFDTVEDYVAAQLESEGAHLDAFAAFVLNNRLDDELRDKRWADFARGYNGPGYADNRYDHKLADAYARCAAGRQMPSASPAPQEQTLAVQRALNRHGADLVADGKSGPNTRAALRDFQRDAGLPISGRADPATLSALGLFETHDPVAVSALLDGTAA